ncbi:MAG: hypothetical protein U5K69_19600 [Balneolaceae bacterium]|nr:hypothetical protein [Balneolaceae bacterium]
MRNAIIDSIIEMEPIDIQTDSRPMPLFIQSHFRLLHRTTKQVYHEAVAAPGLLVGTSEGRHYAEPRTTSSSSVPLWAALMI